jgi:hypothetical protein
VSLLDLLRDRAPRTTSDALVFVKIDVEGMEQRVLTPVYPRQHGEIVILYEDHGNRVTPTTAFLAERGFVVAFMADDGTLERIVPTNLKRLNELKTNSARGYNLLAVAPKGAAATRLDKLYPALKLGST